MLIIDKANRHDRDLTDQFSALAARRKAGDLIPLPTQFDGFERRLYVRRTMREDHQFRIRNRPEGAQKKFDTLAADVYDFFRGSALIYYRDYVGTDLHLPIVLAIGDVHPENFGVMPNEDGAPIFQVNDFDEAFFAPFSYDIKRGAVGFYIQAKEAGFKKKWRRKIVRAFVEGYLESLRSFARDDRERWHEYRIDNSPKMIRKLLEGALSKRADFLDGKVEIEEERFLSTDEIVPHTAHIAEFQEIVDDYRKDISIDDRLDDEFFTVRDVAIKKDSGTASLGLDRYWILIRGKDDRPESNVILEMKQARRSALYGLIPDHEEIGEFSADQIVKSHHIHLVGGDPFYGRAKIDEKSYLIRERSPLKDDIDVDELDKKGMRKYAHICGQVLAQTHARSDEDTGILDGDAEVKILSSIIETVFIADVVRFAQHACAQIYCDYAFFVQDHSAGAFTFVHDGK